MMETTGEHKGRQGEVQEGVFSRFLRAGKRVYFFDVRKTASDDYYLTITESTKRLKEDGTFATEKHRLFIYKEDFAGFSQNLNEVMEFIIREKGEIPLRKKNN